MSLFKFYFKNTWILIAFSTAVSVVAYGLVGLKEGHINEALVTIAFLIALNIGAFIGRTIEWFKDVR